MRYVIRLLLPLLLFVQATSACSPSTRVGYVDSEIRFGTVRLADGGAGTTGGNPAVVIEDYDLSERAPLKYLGMCLDIDDEVEFTAGKSTERSLSPLERVPMIDLPHAMMAIKVRGLPAGTYTQVSVPINAGCGGSPAVGIANSFGEFKTDHGMELVFEGILVQPAALEKAEVTIFLDIKKYVTAFSAVSSNAEDRSTLLRPIELAIENNRGRIINGL